MTDNRPTSGRDNPTTAQSGGDATQDTLAELVRVHGAAPPFNSVDWHALAQRVTGDADAELNRRRLLAAARLERAAGARDATRVFTFGGAAAARLSLRASGARRAKRHWFEVTAGWVRPAMIAAAVVSGIAVTLSVAVPATPGGYGAGDSAAALVSASSAYSSDDADTGDSAMAAAVVGRTSDQQVDFEIGPKTRDALLTAVVEER